MFPKHRALPRQACSRCLPGPPVEPQLLFVVPSYLERGNGISDYAIYVAEQQSDGQFNLALSRNVAAMAALDDGASGYFVFHDVDVISVCGVDYGPRNFNTAWFLTAGSCKVSVADFIRANG